jgi:DNA-binding NtrC family response regulator
VTQAQRGDAGLELARQEDFTVVVTDLRLPGFTGLQVVRELHAARPRLPIILMTAYGTTETAIEATKQGAYDYMVKPFEMEEFVHLVGKAARSAQLMREAVELGKASAEGEAIVGQSRAMQEVYKEIGRMAAQSATVLVRGETGTGKELVARALYQHGERAQKPFIAVNCAAIPETLLESELFGHERGAFTGAENRRIGRFEQANGGTLFLDEVGDMTMFTQAKLLRVLQERCIQRVGGKETINVDVRVIAATHSDLQKAIQEGKFREDLYYRLTAFVIQLPPLRERTEDIPELAAYALRRIAHELKRPAVPIQPAAIELLQTQPWPGNVRQLANVLRQAAVEARGFSIGVEHVQAALNRSPSPPGGTAGTFEAFVDQLLRETQAGEVEAVLARTQEFAERVLFTRALEMVGGDEGRAARALGLSRPTFRERVRRLGIGDQAGAPGPARN